MAIKTVWPVKHSCGHQADHDLSDKRPSERASLARWLESKDCSDCWRAARDRAWRAERRAEEAAVIVSWEAQAGMAALEGSDKAVGWGSRVRHQLMTASYHHHVLDSEMSDDEFEDRFEAPARTVTSASWWIDQRDTDRTDMAELLADVSADAKATMAENPYSAMMTWLDWQSPVTVWRALGSVAGSGQAADRRFDLWLALVDLHLEELGRGRSGLVWEWRWPYADGWSPRTAAFAAWANNVRSVDLTGEED